MSFKVFTTTEFQREFKRLFKKHKSLKADLQLLVTSLEHDPSQGTPIGQDCYKIRLAITSTSKGKSGGARVITYVKVADEFLYLLSIYAKSEKDSLTEKELKKLLKSI